MPFDPNAPFETVGEPVKAPSKFDPNAKFEKVEPEAKPEQSQLDKIQMALSRGASKANPMLGLAMNPAVQGLAIKGLDYADGLARTAVAGVARQATLKDAVDALMGNAPRASEYYKRAGVPEMGKVDLPLLGEVTGRDALGNMSEMLVDPLAYAGGPGKAGAAMQKAGKSIYKSGMKRIDEIGAKYGKAPVSDLLFKERIRGTAPTIAEKMDKLAETRLGERNSILESATNSGAETDVGASLSQATAHIAELRAMGDPRLEGLISKMEGEVETLRRAEGRPAVPSQPEVRATSLTPDLLELPVSQTQRPLDRSRMLETFESQPGVGVYDAPTLSKRAGTNKASLYENRPGENGRGIVGEPVVNNPVDRMYDLPVGGKYENVRPAPYEVGQVYPEYVISEARPGSPKVAGPTPIQMTGMKTNSYSVVGDAGYNEARQTPLWKRFEKAVASGQKREVEASVGRTLGEDAAQTLATKNDELGRLLSTQERAEMDAAIYNRKNAVTKIDALGVGHAMGGHNPLGWVMPAVGKAVETLNGAGPRTYIGMGLSDLGQNYGKFSPVTGAANRALVDQTDSSPWDRMSKRIGK